MLLTTDAPTISDTLFPGTEDLSPFFQEDENRLPVCLCETLEEHRAVFQALRRKDIRTNWRKAALAAALDRAFGQRSDRHSGRTPIQEFCRAEHIGPEYVSRLAKTYRAFDQQPLDPGIKELLLDSQLSF